MKYINCIINTPDDHFLIVTVWHERADYTAATTSSDDACFMDYSLAVNEQDTHCYPLFGLVNFIKGNLDAGIVAHEFFHAAMQLAKICGKDDDEEFIAYSLQHFNSEFWHNVQVIPLLYEWVYGDEEYAEE